MMFFGIFFEFLRNSLTGLGKRRCLGENLAKSSLFLLFTSIMHEFDIEPIGNLPNLKGRDGITLSPQPYKARLTKRRKV
jgi:methyl farnesoate epoxidase / farnesoate epoxidase